MDENFSTPRDGLVDETFHIWKWPDQVLLFIIFDIQDQVSKVVWEARAYRERLFDIAYAYDVSYLQGLEDF